MAKKLFIAGLAYSVTDAQLQEHFAQAGNVVSAKVIFDKATGKSKGFGFVEMSTEEEAEKATRDLTGSSINDRMITVREARPQTENNNRGGYGDRDRGRNF